ncbi:MAG: hypothetical protein GEV10_21885 [Streptosporangiales bacterium]|nr:hypothetical protein [Streptosporangiales bacterium]
MINPGEIPLFTGSCDGIETAAYKLRTAGTGITTRGSAIHSTVQSLRLSYRAPETENLFAATEPVRKLGLEFGEHVRAVSHILEAFAAEMRPIAADLKNLKADAQDFVDENSCDPDQAWLEDEAKVDKNNEMIDDVSAKVEQMWDVERKYANAIEALFGGTRKFVAGDTFLGQMAGLGLLPGVEAYGMSSIPEVEIDGELQEGVELPWGTAAEWDAPWYVDVAAMGASYYKGLYIDGLLGTIDGITTLIPIQAGIHALTGWEWANTLDDTGAAWENLGMTVAGVLFVSSGAILVYGGAKMAGWTSEGVDEFVSDAMNAQLGAVKGIVAWDTWGEDPARAAGATTFNVGTFFLPGPKGLAASGKAGGMLQAGVKLVDDAVAAVVKVDKVVLPKVGHLVKTINEGIGEMKTALKDTLFGKTDIPHDTNGLSKLNKLDDGATPPPPTKTPGSSDTGVRPHGTDGTPPKRTTGGKSTDEILASGKSVDEILASGKSTDEILAGSESVDEILASGKSTDEILTYGKHADFYDSRITPPDEIPPPRTDKDGPSMEDKEMNPRYEGEERPRWDKDGRVRTGVQYFSPTKLEQHRLFAHNGRLYTTEGKLFDSTGARSAHGGEAIYAMDKYGNLYASKTHEVGKLHHSSFLGGKPVAGAGELTVRNGKAIYINRRSGHYWPDPEHLYRVVDALRRAGVRVDKVDSIWV